jgi:hypothetical protein
MLPIGVKIEYPNVDPQASSAEVVESIEDFEF